MERNRTYAPQRPARRPAKHPMRRLTGGETLVRALAAHGADLAFGIPGTHNLEIYRHLGAHGIRHIATRHEQGAGYAADGYARTTGRPGIAVTTTGPALLNIAAAVGQAYSDSVPLLVVSPGMPLRHPAEPIGVLHELHGQSEALGRIAAFSHRVSSVGEIDAAVARAFSFFRSGRPRPVHLEIPYDLLEEAEPVGAPRIAPPTVPPRPAPDAVREAAEALSSARRPALVLGGGARGAADACRALAEQLGAPVVTTANGKGVVPESHALSVGVALHSPAVRSWLASCDVVLAVGTELAESDLWCDQRQLRDRLRGTLIRADIDPAQMYAGLPAGIALVGDAHAVLAELLPAVTSSISARGAGEPSARPSPESSEPSEPSGSSGSSGSSESSAGRSVDTAAALRAARDEETVARSGRWLPYLSALRSTLAPDAILTSDSAQCCYYGALPHLPVDPPGRYLHPTGFGTLGYALPAAIGAKAAEPGREVVALSGDGGLQFTVQELATAAQLGLPLPVVVFDNAGYGEIRDEMAARGDTPTAVDLAPVDLTGLARAYGGQGSRAGTPDELAKALHSALRTPGPTVITIPEGPVGDPGRTVAHHSVRPAMHHTHAMHAMHDTSGDSEERTP
ncbi:5-guanidino-2-oxopentanoate decarboxylase [Streptomyces sp. NPDC048639]|uniref:5-guanidino-2-oxopentanoate decarboxylase n=1 Tax=Streptomyces sp. NPDC048639 TaxID=3365581 RepID=UPI0037127546